MESRRKAGAAASGSTVTTTTAGLKALEVLPTNRILHRLDTNEVVQIHIDMKR